MFTLNPTALCTANCTASFGRQTLYPMLLYPILGLVLALCLALAAAPANAQIYKIVDEHGNVSFTDVPPKDKSAAVQVSPGNTYSAQDAQTAPPTIKLSPDAEADAEATTFSYERVSIVSPAQDQAIRENSGNLSVTLDISPTYEPSSGHVIQLLLDGRLFESGTATTLGIENVDRGTHTLTAQVVDPNGQVLAASNPTTFHMMRVSVLAPPRAASN